MTLQDILAVLLQRLVWLIIIPLVVSAAVGYYYFFRTQNEYTASAKLYVLVDYRDASGNTRYDTSTSTQFAGDYQQLIKTHEVLADAAQRLGVAGMGGYAISVQAVANTRVLDLRVTSGDPQKSQDAANAIAESFVQYMRTMTKTDGVTIASEAQLPTSPSGPARVRNTALAFLAALFACAAVFLAQEMLNTRIKTAVDAEEWLKLPVLASIESYRRAVEQCMKKIAEESKTLLDCTNAGTRESVKMLSLNLRFSYGDKPMRSLALTSTSAAEGKSSLTVLLGQMLYNEGNRVLLIDLDFRSPTLGRYLGTRGNVDLVDMITYKLPPDSVVTHTNVPGPDFVDSRHTTAIAGNLVNTPEFAQFRDWAGQNYDIVLVDTPPLGVFVDAASVAPAVDGVLLVVGSGRVDRKDARKVIGQLQRVGATVPGIALNFVKRNSRAARYYDYRYGRVKAKG